MATTDAGRLHPPVGGEVGGAERQPLHARRGGADRFDVGDPSRRLEDGVEQQRPVEAGSGFELGDQPVDIVDVLGPLDLGDHDHLDAVADLGDRGGQVVEDPRRVERVDPCPELGGGVIPRLGDLDQPGPRRLLLGCRDAIFEVGEQDVDRGRDVRNLGDHLRLERRAGSGSPGLVGTGISRTGSGAPTASGRKKSLGGRTSRSVDSQGSRTSEPARTTRRSATRPATIRGGRSSAGAGPRARSRSTCPRAWRSLPT